MRRHRSFVCAASGLALLALMFALSPAGAQLRQNIRTKDFAFPQYYDREISPNNPTNRLKLLLRGAVGQLVSNDLYGVTTARLEHYPFSGKGTNLVALTPYCLLNTDDRTVTSTARVDITANDGMITVHGDTGFFFDMTNQVLIVSNRNRATIRHSLFQNAKAHRP